MTSSKSKPTKGRSKKAPVTEVRCAEDLHATLAACMSGQSGEATLMLEEILGSLKREFDPASITMTSTNIPDAIIKLSSVLVETSEATTKVFQLVEKQKSLVEEHERCLAAIEKIVRLNPYDSQEVLGHVARGREAQRALREVAHEIVMAQAFQDLCSQKVQKVIRLIGDLDCYLRALLSQFKLAPSTGGCDDESQEDKGLDQGATDDILKGLGI